MPTVTRRTPLGWKDICDLLRVPRLPFASTPGMLLYILKSTTETYKASGEEFFADEAKRSEFLAKLKEVDDRAAKAAEGKDCSLPIEDPL